MVAIACACAVLATLLAGVAPASALRVGLVVLVLFDVILVATGGVATTSNALHQAASPAGLPSFQDATLGPAIMGYGDLFGAAVLGAILTSEGRSRGRAAAAVLVSALGFGLLLTVFSTLPATVPLLAGPRRRRSGEAVDVVEHRLRLAPGEQVDRRLVGERAVRVAEPLDAIVGVVQARAPRGRPSRA